jgi:hypothetical protein
MESHNMQILRPRESPPHIEGKYLLFLGLFLGGRIKGKSLPGMLKFRGKIRQFYDDLDNNFINFNDVGFRGKIPKPAPFE